MDKCIFCDSNERMTNEHIFPLWLQRHMGIKKQDLEIAHHYPSGPQVLRKHVYDKHVNGHVCETCNGGWMATLEEKVKPTLTKMLENQQITGLSNREVGDLALWVSKTALALHNASPYEKVVPLTHYQLVPRGKAPECYWCHIAHLKTFLKQPVWIQDQNWVNANRFIPNHALKEELKRTYRIVYGFGHFAARVAYFPLSLRLQPLESGVQVIYPQ